MKMFYSHPWVYPISLAYLPDELTPALKGRLDSLLEWLRSIDCTIQAQPTNATDLIITTTSFGKPIERSEALFFHAKRRYGLRHRPSLLTIIDISESDYQHWLAHFAELAKQPAETQPAYRYPALGPQAVEVLVEQARRRGPEVALGRFLQSYVKSFRVMALRTDGAGQPLRAVHFDLAGAHPTTDATDAQAFAQEVGLRILAATCTKAVNDHLFSPDPLPKMVWDRLEAPKAMLRAGEMFTEFDFFIEPVSIEKLLGYRDVSQVVSAQYSEGCYAVFEPEIPGLITTATGSARLVDKRAISYADQAIVLGVKQTQDGAIVRPVAEMERVIPSVEAVEMMGICEAVPTHLQTTRSGESIPVPNVRAILHSHIGVAAFNPERVESVFLPTPYYHHLVSCGTGALARGTTTAFASSTALCDLADPRAVVFLEQPGHGVVIVEKWIEGKQPFEVIHDYLTEGHLQMTPAVPQGPVAWRPGQTSDGRLVVQKD